MLNMYKMFKSASIIARDVAYHFPGGFASGVAVHTAMEMWKGDAKEEAKNEAQKTKNKPE